MKFVDIFLLCCGVVYTKKVHDKYYGAFTPTINKVTSFGKNNITKFGNKNDEGLNKSR